MEPLQFKLKTLTPIWTGGIDRTCDRLHETSLIGSLRWWYEAMVRGLGGYACDPTNNKCEYHSEKKKKSLCAACYLFGTTGWARLFRLETGSIPSVPLHFRTTRPMNKAWLGRIFGGEPKKTQYRDGSGKLRTKTDYFIDNLTVFYGPCTFYITTRGIDEEYVLGQLAILFDFISQHGGIGAKLQHGFGQVNIDPPPELAAVKTNGVGLVKRRLSEFNNDNKLTNAQWPNLRHFFSMNYTFDHGHYLVTTFLEAKAHYGNPSQKNEKKYLPCTFDLRYRGKFDGREDFGLRQWLRFTKHWDWDKLRSLMGETRAMREKERLGSRLFMGMHYWVGNRYRLKIFGFALPSIGGPNHVIQECQEYMTDFCQLEPEEEPFFGENWINSI